MLTPQSWSAPIVVEAYRLDRYDNLVKTENLSVGQRAVVEAYRLDRYDNLLTVVVMFLFSL